MSTTTNAQIATTRLEVTIQGSPEQVWDALTDRIGQWWPEEFYASSASPERTYTLEARAGGRMIEHAPSGAGVLWGTVVGVEPAAKLQVAGTTFPEWGGPSLWYGTWTLAPTADGATLLTFEDSTLGLVSPENQEERGKGWRYLFAIALKSHVEGTVPAPWVP